MLESTFKLGKLEVFLIGPGMGWFYESSMWCLLESHNIPNIPTLKLCTSDFTEFVVESMNRSKEY